MRTHAAGYGGLAKLPRLKRLRIRSGHRVETTLPEEWSQSTALETLTLDGDYFDIVTRLSQRLSSVRRLEIAGLDRADDLPALARQLSLRLPALAAIQVTDLSPWTAMVLQGELPGIRLEDQLEQRIARSDVLENDSATDSWTELLVTKLPWRKICSPLFLSELPNPII